MDAKMPSCACRLRKLLVVGFCGLVGCAMLISADPRIELPAAQQPGENRSQLTVERIYSAPSLSGRILRDTVWSPDGKLLTYLDNGGGDRKSGQWTPQLAGDTYSWMRNICETCCCLRSRVVSRPGWDG